MPRNVALFLLVIALLSALTAPAQPINWDSVRADYITKYQPQQVPAWLFPIIFEEGGGQRDTIYLGYDPNASNNLLGSDTVFGEKLTPVDTNIFNANVCWAWYCGSGLLCDTVSKVNISNLSYYAQCGGGVFDLAFIKSTFHLKMYWDRAAFYSDSLPFYRDSINYPPNLPKAMGEIWCSNLDPYYDNCMIASHYPPFIMPAEAALHYPFHANHCDFVPPDLSQPWFAGASPCAATDSIVIYGDTTTGSPSTPDWMPLNLVIRKFGAPVGIEAGPSGVEVRVYPNPASVSAAIHIKPFAPLAGKAIRFTLYSITGKPVLQTGLTTELTQVELGHLSSGVYYYQIATDAAAIYSGKIAIQ